MGAVKEKLNQEDLKVLNVMLVRQLKEVHKGHLEPKVRATQK